MSASIQCNEAIMVTKDVFLHYPDHNKPFDIYADASDTQLGAAIFQDGVPIAFFSRKLNSAQCNYTMGEKEILSVVETLKEFHTLLYGCREINVHTDRKNNIFTKQSNQRILRWCLFLEDYGINLQYIKGCHNHLADTLSHLPFNERQKDTTAIRQPDTPNAQYTESLAGPAPQTIDSFFSLALDDDNLLDCFVNLPSS
jgi:RNase H-like domain found in reverse transcriptase